MTRCWHTLQASLKRMLRQFMADTMKDMPPEEMARAADNLDMSVVRHTQAKRDKQCPTGAPTA